MTDPLFNDSRDDLMKIVRIEPANDDNTLAAIDQALRDVRLGFFSKLGKTRSQTIAGYTYSENPVTDDEETRARAAGAEAIWLTLLLMQRLPVLFQDNSASVNDSFNDEPLTRDSIALLASKKELKAQLEDMLLDLADTSSTLDTSVKASLNGPSRPCLNSQTFPGHPNAEYGGSGMVCGPLDGGYR